VSRELVRSTDSYYRLAICLRARYSLSQARHKKLLSLFFLPRPPGRDEEEKHKFPRPSFLGHAEDAAVNATCAGNPIPKDVARRRHRFVKGRRCQRV